MSDTSRLRTLFNQTRQNTEDICTPLQIEDYVVQPIVDVSPPKWHLGHTTWFFEEFVLSKYDKDYQRYDEQFAYVFNSYYESVGKRVVRTDRGNLSRPTVDQIYDYRKYITSAVDHWINSHTLTKEHIDVLVIGIHHEKQHQELLWTDIKYILGNNPLMPAYDNQSHIDSFTKQNQAQKNIKIPEGIYPIGHTGTGFCYDNELPVHRVFLEAYEIASTLVTNREWLDFIQDQGYQKTLLWHTEGWDWVQKNKINAPQYWFMKNEQWYCYTLQGVQPVVLDAPVCHISYYEAAAFAAWCGKRLPTETEWEVASSHLDYGTRWEWTESAYLPYPNYQKAEGALGEYNGKFMVNQKVLRGHSVATAQDHARPTYRNFFHTQLRWQFTGLRLASSI